MRVIINNLLYDTDKSEIIYDNRTKVIFKTRNGRYFKACRIISFSGYPATVEYSKDFHDITPLSKDELKYELRDAPETYRSVFGAVEEA